MKRRVGTADLLVDAVEDLVWIERSGQPEIRTILVQMSVPLVLFHIRS